MAPSTLLAVFLFILLIAPGLFFDLLSRNRRALASESAFRETSRVVLLSLAFAAIGVMAVLLIGVWKPHWIVDPRELLRGNKVYLVSRYPLLLRTMTIEVGAAMGSAYLLHRILRLPPDTPSIRQVSLWVQIFRTDAKGLQPCAHIRTTEGVEFFGPVIYYTPNIELVDREIVLGSPLFRVDENGQRVRLNPDVRKFVVRGAAIEFMTVEYYHRGDL